MKASVRLDVVEPTALHLAMTRVRQYYGHVFRPISYDVVDGLVRVKVIGEIPVEIRDEASDETRVCWLRLGPVGVIDVEGRASRVKGAPSIRSMFSGAEQNYRAITRSVEADLVYAARQNFGKLTNSRFMLQSLKKAILELEARIDGMNEKEILQVGGHHFRYLLSAGYVERNWGMIVPSAPFLQLRRGFNDREAFAETLLGIVLAREYDAITSSIQSLRTYVRAALSYYELAVTFGEPIELNVEDVLRHYREMYRPSPKVFSSFRNIHLRELVTYGILKQKKRAISGDPEIYDEFYERAHDKIPVQVRTPVSA